jgi:DegV family protein with EDD domain
MARVAVVTDSTAYLPAELAAREGIQVVPLYVVFGGDRTVPETEISDYPAFFEELRRADSLPTTSQPSVGDFVSVFEPLLAQGRDVVSIHISGGLSGTSEAARQAAQALERDGKGGERVRVIDSKSAAGGLGLVVLAAARAAGAGAAGRPGRAGRASAGPGRRAPRRRAARPRPRRPSPARRRPRHNHRWTKG